MTDRSGDATAALDALKSAFARANPASARLHAEACRVLPGGNTRSNLYHQPFPLCFTGGQGATLTDVDGHDYVDFLGEYTAGVYGHSHPAILRAIREVSAAGLSIGGQTEWEGRFAKLLVERFPGLERVRFTNSGTEANIMAIGAARAFTGRDKVIVFDGGYHGAALTFVLPGHKLNAPYSFLNARYNDTASVRALLEQHAGEVAAVMVEPMLSSGGCIPGRDAFLYELRDLTTAAGVVLIFDEVVTSRLGARGIHGALGITPDLVTLGKYIGGGLGCGAFGGKAEIMAMFDPARAGAISHAGTFNNNTLTMGVGVTAVEEVFTGEAAEMLCERGDRLRERLNEVVEGRQMRMQFTGRGSSMNAHFTRERIDWPSDETRGHATEKGLFYFHLLSHGIYAAPRGMLNVSMVHTQADFDRVVEATDEFAATYGQMVSGDELQVAA